MSATHECPAPSCKRQVPYRMLACSAHWFELPKELRGALWSAYRLYGQLSKPHLDAVDACVEWLERNG